MKVVVFDIWADFGHFRVPYTTTSPISFPVPPKPSLYGILGAILGLDKRKYLKYFSEQKWLFSVSIRNPISKMRMVENFINVKVANDFASLDPFKSSRTQIRLELLKNPKYRIYCSSEDPKIYDLYNMLKNHKTVYSISLGISELLANYNIVGMYEGVLNGQPDDFEEVTSIVPLSSLNSIEDIDLIVNDRKYIKVHMPVELSPSRELLKSDYFLIETNGKSVFVRPNRYIYITELKERVILY